MSHRTFSIFSSALRASTLVALVGVAAIACSGSPTGDETFEILEGADSFEGEGRPDALAPSDRAIFAADRAYLQSLTAPGVAMGINHADERQHRFVAMRLRMAGKDPQNSPQIFQRLADVRAEHLAKGYKAGAMIPTTSFTNGVDDLHYFNKLNVGSTTLEVVASGTTDDALYYGYVDALPMDAAGQQLGSMAYSEVYGPMTYGHARAVGNLALTSQAELAADSLLIEDTVNFGYRETYIYEKNKRPITFSTPAVNAPADIKGGDNCVGICLNRTWTGDCDYDLTSTPNQLKVPLVGSVAITAPGYVFDQAAIEAYKAGTAVDGLGNPDAGGQIRLVLANNGGGCGINANNPAAAPMQSFWQTVTLSGDKRTLSWNMAGAAAALFNQGCRVVQNQIELSMNVKLPYAQGSFKNVYNMYLTNLPSSVSPNPLFPTCMKMTNSCLAAGTLIDIAGGQSLPIESLKIGDSVASPFDRQDGALLVSDVAKGFEAVPMVRIEDEKGHGLLLTEMHPVPVEGRGMVLGRDLQVGDVVTTKEGPAKLLRVSREKFDGAVHNLKVGDAGELSRLGADQTQVFANGILVGDGQVQAKYEAIAIERTRHAAGPTRLPIRWRADYQASARR